MLILAASHPISACSPRRSSSGSLIGVFGHIIKSRTLIITGILVIGLVSAYFSFVLQPSGR